jgi:hypothetical protein
LHRYLFSVRSLESAKRKKTKRTGCQIFLGTINQKGEKQTCCQLFLVTIYQKGEKQSGCHNYLSTINQKEEPSGHNIYQISVNIPCGHQI